MHGCTCNNAAFMIYAHANIHHLHNGRMAVEENDLTGTLECGSFITANDNIDGLFGKYRQTQCKSGTTCTVCMEAHVINEE